MYCGLLALDDATRRWFGAHGDVLADVAAHHAAQFFIAAPGLRIRDDVVQLPGGAAATAAWESAVGKRVSDPAAFVKAIVGRNEVALSYFIGSIAQLSAEQARWMLGVDGSEQSRATAIKRMVTVYDRMSAGWDATEKPFWRPTLDPALLASDLRRRENGAPNLPGTTAFWSAVFSSSEPGRETTESVSTLVTGAPVEFSWLCEQVFVGGQTLIRPPYQLVLFASRQIPALTPGTPRTRSPRSAARASSLPWLERSNGRTSPASAPTPVPPGGRGRSRPSTTNRAGSWRWRSSRERSR